MIIHAVGEATRRFFVKYSAVFLTALFLASSPVGANDSTPDVATVKVTPALWMVTEGAHKTYLLGSFHLLPKNYDWFHGKIGTSFDAADELVMETVMDQTAMATIQGMVMKNGSFTDSDSLKNHLDAAHYQKMLGYSKATLGLNESVAQKMKPWFMAINLSVVSIMSSGMDPNLGVDKVLESKAQAKKLIISGLETPAAQMSALIDHPLPVQTAMLTDTLDKLDDFKSYITLYLDAWSSGDADKIGKAMLDDMIEYQDMYQALMVDRNNNWMPAIEAHIKNDKNSFIVVGAAHLVGDDGIVKLLRDKGYTVEKIQ